MPGREWGMGTVYSVLLEKVCCLSTPLTLLPSIRQSLSELWEFLKGLARRGDFVRESQPVSYLVIRAVDPGGASKLR